MFKNLARPRKSLEEFGLSAGHDQPLAVFDSCRVNVDFEIVAALVTRRGATKAYAGGRGRGEILEVRL